MNQRRGLVRTEASPSSPSDRTAVGHIHSNKGRRFIGRRSVTVVPVTRACARARPPHVHCRLRHVVLPSASHIHFSFFFLLHIHSHPLHPHLTPPPHPHPCTTTPASLYNSRGPSVPSAPSPPPVCTLLAAHHCHPHFPA